MNRFLIQKIPIAVIVKRIRYSTIEIDLYQCDFDISSGGREEIKTIIKNYAATTRAYPYRWNPRYLVGNIDIYFMKVPNIDAPELMKRILKVINNPKNRVPRGIKKLYAR